MSSRREWVGKTGRYGAAGESSVWKVAYDHYYWDRLKEAHEASSELGAGHWGYGLVGFRMIEGEWITRDQGELHEVAPWLTIETIPDEMPEPIEMLSERVIDACNQVAWRFGFQHGAPVLVSVLAEESNVPWMPGRHGYCIDKHPYDKICVPAYSLRDHHDLEHVVLHEYAHVVTLNLTEGQCPHWLDEAVAMVSGGGVDKRAWSHLTTDGWRNEWDLDKAYLRNREEDSGRQDVWLAYQQSAVIGFYLQSLEGDKGLTKLLSGFTNNSFFHDVMLRVKHQTPVDDSLREVYGFGTKQLFDQARQWLSKQH